MKFLNSIRLFLIRLLAPTNLLLIPEDCIQTISMHHPANRDSTNYDMHVTNSIKNICGRLNTHLILNKNCRTIHAHKYEAVERISIAFIPTQTLINHAHEHSKLKRFSGASSYFGKGCMDG